jgi:hypothetical protein
LRTIVPTISIVLSLCGSPLAAPISSGYTCIKSHEQEATNNFQAFAVGALAKCFNDRGIEVNKPTLQVNVSLTIAAGDDAPYAAFTGTGSNATGLSGTIAGTAAGKDGTKFNVILNSCLRFVIALYVIQKRDHHSMSTLVGDNERHDPPWRRLWPHVLEESRESTCCAPGPGECASLPCAGPTTRRRLRRNRPSKRFKGFTATFDKN